MLHWDANVSYIFYGSVEIMRGRISDLYHGSTCKNSSTLCYLACGIFFTLTKSAVLQMSETAESNIYTLIEGLI